MPLKTFLNLSRKRQKEIINVCMEEFAKNDYESASLSSIIKTLGLAKGSFYRYFESKKDLYIYLVSVCRGVNTEYIEKFYKDPGLPFFDAMLKSFMAAIRKEEEYPFYLQFSFRVSTEKRYQLFGDLVQEWRERKNRVLREIIEFHQQNGYIRGDIEIDKLIQSMNYIVLGMREYLFLKYLKTTDPGTKERLAILTGPEIRADIMGFVRILKNGMENGQQGADRI